MWRSFRYSLDLKKNNRGVVSVFTLLLLVVLVSFGLSLLESNESAFKELESVENSQQATWLAQGALSEARYYLSKHPEWTGTSEEQWLIIGGKGIGSYEYSVTKTGGNIFDVVAKGYVPNKMASPKIMRTLSERLRIPNPYVVFEDGFESGGFGLWQGQSNEVGILWDVTNITARQGALHARAYKTEDNNNARVARLISHPLNLFGYDKAILRFSYRMKLGMGTSFKVYQSNDGGVNWSEIYNDSSNATKSSYSIPSVKLELSPLTENMQFEFRAYISDKDEEWYLDAVQISTPFVMYDLAVDS